MRTANYICDIFSQPIRLNLTYGVILYGIGIFIYYIMPCEPKLLLPVFGFFSFGLVVSCFKKIFKTGILRSYIIFCWLPIFGAMIAMLHTERQANLTLPVSLAHINLQGEVMRGEDGLRYGNILLRVSQGNGEQAVEKYWRVRLQETLVPIPGSIIQVRVKPIIAEQPIFKRYNFFHNIHAYAITLGNYQIMALPQSNKLSIRLARFRLKASRKIDSGNAKIDGVARALLIGMKKTIPKDVLENMRIAGLGHMLAISGLHFGIFSFGMFALIRALLASIPSIAQRWHIKKIAVIFAAIVGLGYLFLSGSAVSAKRSFIMLCLICLGILRDERVFTRNLLATAALILLSFTPYILLSPSFQMSFSAVLALIVFFHKLGETRYHQIHRIYRFPLSIILSTIIASLAVAPFTLTHFGYISTYSILANFPAIPILTFWVMPWGAICLLLMPLDLHQIPLFITNHGIGLIIVIADFIAMLPQSRFVSIPPMRSTLFLLIFGGLMMQLSWHKIITRLSLIMIMLGIMLQIIAPKPLLILYDWSYGFQSPHLSAYVFTAPLPRGNRRKKIMRYLRSDDIYYLNNQKYANNVQIALDYQCSQLTCYLFYHGKKILIAHHPEGTEKSFIVCRDLSMVVSLYETPTPCAQDTEFISGDKIRKHGGIYVFMPFYFSRIWGAKLYIREFYQYNDRIWYR